MTEPKFTPGPWEFYEVPEDDIGVIGDGPICVIEITDYGTHGGIETIVDRLYDEDIAHLIAAAPELYSAGQEMLEAFRLICDRINWKASAMDADAIHAMNTAPIKLETALSKARGEV